jgi:hypothetical protein
MEENMAQIELVGSCLAGIKRNHILNHVLWVLTAHYHCIVTIQVLVGRYGIVKL